MNNKDVLLVGCGAEIGAMLLAMNDPGRDGFAVSAIITNPIDDDPKNPHLHPLHSLYARIVLAEPHMVDAVRVDVARGQLVVRERAVDVFWGDVAAMDLGLLKRSFAACIVATSKTHIGDRAFMKRFRAVAEFIVGVSEAKELPTLYTNLIDVPERFLHNPPRLIGNERIFALGSCQSGGWQAQLRGLIESVARGVCTAFEMAGVELDIVHPDTPQGRLGTKSVEARSQDPRNNLRPSFSQVEMAMRTLFPGRHAINTISLRTLIMPPGYQISRFFFRYERSGGTRFTREEIVESFGAIAQAHPAILRMADVPLGSRGYEMVESAAIILSGERYFRYADNPFAIDGPTASHVAELITQGYVHNTRGYCRSVLIAVQYLLTATQPKAFFPSA